MKRHRLRYYVFDASNDYWWQRGRWQLFVAGSGNKVSHRRCRNLRKAIQQAGRLKAAGGLPEIEQWYYTGGVRCIRSWRLSGGWIEDGRDIRKERALHVTASRK